MIPGALNLLTNSVRREYARARKRVTSARAPLAVVINALRAIERWSAYRAWACFAEDRPMLAHASINRRFVNLSASGRNVVTARNRSAGSHSGYILPSTAPYRGLKPRRWVHPPLVAFCLTWFKANRYYTYVNYERQRQSDSDDVSVSINFTANSRRQKSIPLKLCILTMYIDFGERYCCFSSRFFCNNLFPTYNPKNESHGEMTNIRLIYYITN